MHRLVWDAAEPLAGAGAAQPLRSERGALLRFGPCRICRRIGIGEPRPIGMIGGNALRPISRASRKAEIAKLEAIIAARFEILKRDMAARTGAMIIAATAILLAAKLFG
jgi:hypothetical protein